MTTSKNIRPIYTITFKVNDIDLSSRIEKVSVVNTLNSIYPIFILKLNFNSKDYYLEELYGHKNASLTITLTTENSVNLENTLFDLLIIHMDIPLSIKKNNSSPDNNDSEQLIEVINIIALSKLSYEVMSTEINKIVDKTTIKSSSNGSNEQAANQTSESGPSEEQSRDNFEFGESTNRRVENPEATRSQSLGDQNKNQFGFGESKNTKVDESPSFYTNNPPTAINNTSNGSFNFGTSTNSRNNNGFNFGESTNTQKSTKDFGNKDFSASPSDNKNFGFGESTNSRSDGGFGFGESTNRPSDNVGYTTANGSNGNGFGFGESTNRPSDNGFGFGKPTNESVTEQYGVNKPVQDTIKRSTNNSSSNNGSLTPINVINSLFEEYITGIEKNFKTENFNNSEITQCIIPPMSFISAIKFIEDKFGIFKGPLFVYCTADNKFNMWDLSKVIQNDVAYTVHFMALSMEGSEDILNKSSETDDQFFTHHDLKSINSTSSKIMDNGYEILVTKNPLDKFTQNVSFSIDDIINDICVGDGSKKLLLSDSAKKRKNVIYDDVVGESSDENNSYVKNKLSNLISKSVKYSFNIDGNNIPIRNLVKVGVPIEIKPYITEYLPLQGKYIVQSSVLSFSRNNTMNYDIIATIDIFRQNITY